MILRHIWLVTCLCSFNAYADLVYITDFSTHSLSDWQHKSFKGHTQYQIVTLDQYTVLQAKSNSSASSLYKNQHIDLSITPYLNWSWRIDKKLPVANEQSKQGDDYAARIYLIVKGWAFWQTKAINYVWSNSTPKSTSWPNPFAGTNVIMTAIRSGTDKTGDWYTEKRHVLNDLKQHFGDDIRYIDGIAIMTDTDNAKGNALSYYNNIYFSEQ